MSFLSYGKNASKLKKRFVNLFVSSWAIGPVLLFKFAVFCSSAKLRRKMLYIQRFLITLCYLMFLSSATLDGRVVPIYLYYEYVISLCVIDLSLSLSI